MYIHQQRGWPHLVWDADGLLSLLAQTRHEQGKLLGRLQGMGFQPREHSTLLTLTRDVVTTSQIEGEHLETESVRSSIARRLGMDIGGYQKPDRHVEGIVEVMLDATRNHEQALTKARLQSWHAALFTASSGTAGLRGIKSGRWRDDSGGPMQVVSGAYGRERVHFEAPSQERLDREMSQFLKWFESKPDIDLVAKAAVAHFWFVTIHPFDDGNGRIARAIADLMLARSEKTDQRFYSMSSQIQKERKDYYRILESCQRGAMDISPWMEWFLNCMKRAIAAAEGELESVLFKSRFWEQHAQESLHPRQRLIINRLLDGFEGKLTTSKWAKLTKTSQDTALRDITDLVEKKILKKALAGGRSSSYELKLCFKQKG